MTYRKMSNAEQRVQHETITAIDSKVTGIDDKFTEFKGFVYKLGKIWLPIFGVVFAGIGSIITLTITGYKWQDNLVKKPQFEHAISALMRQDSILRADLDTVKKNKVNYTDIQQSKNKYTFVTERRINGKITVN